MARQYTIGEGVLVIETGVRNVSVGEGVMITENASAPEYVYIGPDFWSAKYKGIRSDSQLYKGVRTLHP